MQNIGFKEDLTHEFKSDRTCLSDGDIIDAVVAFANTDGGDLYLGVEDDGEITGLHPYHKDSTQLAALIANKTVPPVSVRVEILSFSVPVTQGLCPQKNCGRGIFRGKDTEEEESKQMVLRKTCLCIPMKLRHAFHL